MEAFVTETAEAFAAAAKAQDLTPAEAARAARDLFDVVSETLLEDAPPVSHIAAPNAVVEAVDKDTGRLYRRYLELAYDETANGVRLLGEDMAGKPVQAVFLSDAALKSMHELQGSGPDEPQCKN